MEGPLEVKDAAPAAEEPIKSEAVVQNPDSSDRSDGAVSPPPNCSICLGKLVNTSFTDSCLHQFCFTCLLQWSKIKKECPLCKQTFKSIIHNVRSEEDYDQYHVPRELATLDINFDLGHPVDVIGHQQRIHHYRTTMIGHHRRPHEVVLNPEQVARREQVPSIAPQVPIGERLHRRANPTDYRRTIYRHGIWATALPDVFGQFRECSADYYRREPRELNRLIPWLNRELQVLLNNNAPQIAYVLTVILGALSRYDIRSPEFRDLVRPYFGTFTDHFVHELLNYARTNFDLVGYDQSVTYLPQGLSNEYVSNVVSPASSSSSTSSDDSDVRVLDEAIDLRTNTVTPSAGPHTISVPGPSTVGQMFQLDIAYNVPDVLTISSDFSSSDNDCEVIGYVKPRHERTPEIIELISSDPEEVNVSQASNDNAQSASSAFCVDSSTQPSTSHTIKKRGSTSSSTESDSDSDSDYVCRRSRKYQSRPRKSRRCSTTKRRNRSGETRTRNRVRNLSSSGESDTRKRGTKKTSRTIKKRISSSSDSSPHANELKVIDDKKSRTSQYSTKGTVRVRKDLIKKENRYLDDESFSSDESFGSESEENTNNTKSRNLKRSKREYTTSSSEFDTVGSDRVTRTRGKARQALDAKDLHRKEPRYKDDRQSLSRSSSASSYASQKEKKVSFRRRESQRDRSDDNSNPSRDASRKERTSLKTKSKAAILSTSESDDDRFRSHSQCSNYSSKSYTRRKKSKHKDRHKSKKRKRSNSRTLYRHPFRRLPKHSDSKNDSNR